MRVTDISLNNSNKPEAEEKNGDNILFFFRTPILFSAMGNEIRTEGRSAVVCSSGSDFFLRSSSLKGLKYDKVSFRMTASDRQYADSMNIPFDHPIDINDDFVISGILKAMSSHMMNKSRHQSEFMDFSMRLLFISLSENCLNPTPDKIETIPRYSELKALRDNIYDDPTSHWSAEEISEDMGISRPYFHRLYQAAFGVTYRQDIIESRLIYASELLRTTDMSISSIAETCGYDSDAYFMRQFKQHKGCTPSEYRRRAVHGE